jgi:acyl-coenzyme A thioesterase PaaI-like protein
MDPELKLDRPGVWARSAVCDIRLWTEAPDRLAAQATMTYAIPRT